MADVGIKHLDLDESMIRSIALPAEAERAHRADAIHAEGEIQAVAKPTESVRIQSTEPQAIRLSYKEPRTAVAGDEPSTILFPLPMDLIGRPMDGPPGVG